MTLLVWIVGRIQFLEVVGQVLTSLLSNQLRNVPSFKMHLYSVFLSPSSVFKVSNNV